MFYLSTLNELPISYDMNPNAGKCWNDVSGGVVDGDSSHPFYRYGGLWKNRRAQNKKK